MDIGRAFTYVTEDEDWIKKILLGGVITLIPIVGVFFILGYVLETIKNVIAGQEVPLPEIGDFGGKLVKGLIAWLISLIYALPLILLVICGQGGYFALPMMEGVDQDMIDTLMTVSTVVSACCGCLALLYGILMGLLLPFAWGKYVETEQFGAAFQFGEIFDMLKSNIGPAIIALLVSGVASMVAGLVGAIVCGVGALFTSFYAQLVMGFLYGSLYRQAKTTVL